LGLHRSRHIGETDCVADAEWRDTVEQAVAHPQRRNAGIMKQVVDRIYTVLLRLDDPGFVERMDQYAFRTTNE
jgi:hypothetical protein